MTRPRPLPLTQRPTPHRSHPLRASLAALLLFLAAPSTRADDASENVSDALVDYEPLSTPLTGTITAEGSNTVTNVVNRLAVAFRQIYPKIDINTLGGGSSIAATALLNGKARIATLSRAMTTEEIASLTKKFGYAPTPVVIAAGAISIFVEKNNPIASLTLTQIDSLFSRTFKRGGKAIRNWNQLGVAGPLAASPVTRYIASSRYSGTTSLFKELALDDGDLTLSFTRVLGSSSAVQGVGADPAGITFGSSFLETKRTRHVPIKLPDGTTVEPSYDNVVSGKYPLGRFLYLYINKPPNQPLDPATLEFLKFTLSEDGQRLIARDGNFPLTPSLAAKQLETIK